MIASPFDKPSRLELSQGHRWFSLSLRERAGMRGNGSWKLQTAEVLQLALHLRIFSAFGLRISDFGFRRHFRNTLSLACDLHCRLRQTLLALHHAAAPS